jgi:hypothetical protein
VNNNQTNTDRLGLRFLIREPADVYHAKAKDYLSAHALADFRHCPLLYRKKQLNLIPDRESAAYLVGRAAHVLILEGRQRYAREFAIGGPINPRTGQPFGSATKAYTEWAQRQSRPVLSDDQAALVEQMAAAVSKHELAQGLLTDGVAEGVVRCRYAGQACQARIDRISRDPSAGIIDLKTTDSMDTFESGLRTFGYLHQVAFYRALVSEVSGVVLPVHIVAVEKREPFRCGVWLIAPHVLSAAQRENYQAMQELRRCRDLGHWPTRFEAVRLIDRL